MDRGVAHGLHDFTKDMLLKMVRDDNARVAAFEYKGRCWRMDSVQSYFRFNMDILDTQTRKRPFLPGARIHQGTRRNARTLWRKGLCGQLAWWRTAAWWKARWKTRILFRGVRIAPERACEKLHHHAGWSGAFAEAYIENCILDKQAVIKRNARLIGPAAYPIVIAKNVVI